MKKTLALFLLLLLLAGGCARAPAGGPEAAASFAIAPSPAASSLPAALGASGGVLLPGQAPYAYTEEAVACPSGETTLRGVLARPSLDVQVPMVILLHGFGANRDENSGIFAELAARLAQRGIASVRFDFGGTGESGGSSTQMSIRTEQNDAGAILDYVQGLPFVSRENLGLLGMSMGGVVASLLAARRPAEVKALCLWAPAASLVDQVHAGVYDALLQSPDATLAVNEGFSIGQPFVTDITDLDFFSEAAAYGGSTHILYGALDPFLQGDYPARYAALYPQAIFTVLPTAAHAYQNEDRETVLQTSVDYCAAILTAPA